MKPQPNPIESEGAELRNPNACKEHQNQPHGQRGCMKCVDAHLEYAVGGESPKPELPGLDEILANLTRKAGVNNAENGKDMFKALGKGVFTDEQLRREAKAAIQSLIDEARIKTTAEIAKIAGERVGADPEYTFDAFAQDIAEYAGRITEARLKSKGETNV